MQSQTTKTLPYRTSDHIPSSNMHSLVYQRDQAQIKDDSSEYMHRRQRPVSVIQPDEPPPPYEEAYTSTSQNQKSPREKNEQFEPFPTLHVPSAAESSSRQRSNSATSDISVDDETVLAQALEFTSHPPPLYSRQYTLTQPVAVPQVSQGLGMPFSGGYSAVLKEHGVSMDEFVEFIDNLNVVSTGSPPLQILGLAGGIVGMVPHHIPQIVGNSISLAAKLRTAAVSKTRSTIFMKKANSDFFAPRGLKVELATGEALAAKVGMRPDAPLAGPLPELGADISAHERRLRALDGRVAPVTFDVPPPNKQMNVLERMSASQVQRQQKKSEKKTRKDRAKAVDEIAKNQKDGEKEFAKIDKDRAKVVREDQKERSKIEREADKELAKKPKDLEKIERKREKELRKLDHETEKEMRKLDKETEKVDREVVKEEKKAQKEDKELKQARKILWIVVEDLSDVNPLM